MINKCVSEWAATNVGSMWVMGHRLLKPCGPEYVLELAHALF